MITLTRESLSDDVESVPGQHVWPLRITATSSNENLGPEIFVFHASVDDDVYCGDVFECVASIQQLGDIPIDTAGFDDNGQLVPYFRKDTLTFHARSPQEADELWAQIKNDVDELVKNYLALTNITEVETYVADGANDSTLDDLLGYFVESGEGTYLQPNP